MFTYNCEGVFSQSQIGLLMDVPLLSDVLSFKKIAILVSPPGYKHALYDSTLKEEEYLEKRLEMNISWSSPRKHIFCARECKGTKETIRIETTCNINCSCKYGGHIVQDCNRNIFDRY